MKEAKQRNPDVQLYGLSWAVPGWVGNGSYYEGDDNINYHLKWLDGAKEAHNLTIDYIGVWNERAPDYDWVVRFRQALDASVHKDVVIVGADTGWICDDLVKNDTVAAAIGVLGAHYPITDSTPHKAVPASCAQLDKPRWTSEGWDLGNVNDYAGSMNLARTINYNWIAQGQTAMIVWTAIYAWYSILPFAHPDPRDPVGGMGHGLMSATEPWSGHYRIQPTLYALAHTTQFVDPGRCTYVDTSAVLSGGLFTTSPNATTAEASAVGFSCPHDGTLTIVLETANAKDPIDATLNIVTAAASMTGGGSEDRHVAESASWYAWETCEDSYFKHINTEESDNMSVAASGDTLTVHLKPQVRALTVCLV
jgi:galactosylceramidase